MARIDPVEEGDVLRLLAMLDDERVQEKLKKLIRENQTFPIPGIG